ncbi:MAG: response regulator [bacterium]
MVKGKILLVDDEVDLAETVKLRLTTNDYDVMLAYDGEQALKKVEAYDPDLILLDLKLPGISGEEVFEKLKEKDSTKDIPIILFTASKRDDELVSIGAEDFVLKPFESQNLLDKIQRLLDKRS